MTRPRKASDDGKESKRRLRDLPYPSIRMALHCPAYSGRCCVRSVHPSRTRIKDDNDGGLEIQGAFLKLASYKWDHLFELPLQRSPTTLHTTPTLRPRVPESEPSPSVHPSVHPNGIAVAAPAIPIPIPEPPHNTRPIPPSSVSIRRLESNLDMKVTTTRSRPRSSTVSYSSNPRRTREVHARLQARLPRRMSDEDARERYRREKFGQLGPVDAWLVARLSQNRTQNQNQSQSLESQSSSTCRSILPRLGPRQGGEASSADEVHCTVQVECIEVSLPSSGFAFLSSRHSR